MKRVRTARKVTVSTGATVHVIFDEGRHYMTADHWPEDRDYDVFAHPIRRGVYELIVAREAVAATVGLQDAAELADRAVTGRMD